MYCILTVTATRNELAGMRFQVLDVSFWADVAQLVEHSLGKGEVTSSILVIGSIGCVKGLGFSRATLGRSKGAFAAEASRKGGSNSVVEPQPSKSSRLAGVSEAETCWRDPERSERPQSCRMQAV